MNNISTIIVVKDSPPYLFKTVNSVNDISKEIIIVDIGISKDIVNKLQKYKNVKIVNIKEDVPYVELIREKTKKFASCEYILLLDPDEIVQPKLKGIIKDNLEKYDYFKIPRKNIIFNRWIRYSRWWPDYQVRLFKKSQVTWPKIIHRQPKAEGKHFDIPPLEEFSLLHYNYKNLDEYFSKALRYAKNEALDFFNNDKILTFKETTRRAINEFISRYFAAFGYKDGIQGFILACFQMFYYFLVYFYYLELKKFKTEEKINEGEFFRLGLKETLYWKKSKTIKERLIKKIL